MALSVNFGCSPPVVPLPSFGKILLSLTAASAIVVAASIVPASAMTVGTASGIQAAIDGTSAVEDVAYVCRHRYYSSRRDLLGKPVPGAAVATNAPPATATPK